MREISIIIILIYRKLESVGPVQQKIKLPSPNNSFRLHKKLLLVCQKRSVQVGFISIKQVSVLIRLAKSRVSQKSCNLESSCVVM